MSTLILNISIATNNKRMSMGVFYGFDVLNLTVFTFSAPSGTDGYTADKKMKSEFKQNYDSRQLLIYYKCDHCGNKTGDNYAPIQWTPDMNYTQYQAQTYLGWTLNNMENELVKWAKTRGGIYQSYSDFYGTYFLYGLTKQSHKLGPYVIPAGIPENQILALL